MPCTVSEMEAPDLFQSNGVDGTLCDCYHAVCVLRELKRMQEAVVRFLRTGARIKKCLEVFLLTARGLRWRHCGAFRPFCNCTDGPISMPTSGVTEHFIGLTQHALFFLFISGPMSFVEGELNECQNMKLDAP